MSHPYFDGHCDTVWRCGELGESMLENTGHVDFTRLHRMAPCAQIFALFSDIPPGTGGWDAFQRGHALFSQALSQSHGLARLCRTGEEIRLANAEGAVAALLSVEGAELLDCRLDRLETAWKLGVRAVNLTWNHANRLSGSCAEEPERGLSQEGRAFVRRMEELGVLPDVSHLSDPGFWDLMETARGPVIASHSNSRAQYFDKRSLTDEQFTAIMDRNGTVGINLYADFLGDDPDIDCVIGHMEHFWALGGEKTVALGGDLDGCGRLPRGIRGVQDMERLYDRLLQKNYSETLADDLFFRNLMRVVNQVCTM